MNPLLPGSPRRQPRQGETPAKCWLDWAQALSARRGRIALRHGGLSLVFAQPQAMIFSRIERWRQVSLTFSPQINLAINRILQQAVRHESSAPFGARMEPAFVSPALKPDEGLKSEPWHGEHAGSSGLTPLEKVFARARAEEAGDAVTVSHSRQETLLVQRSLQIAQRVVDERRRLEEQTRRTLVIREQRAAPKTAADAVQEETVFQSPLGSRVGATGVNQFAPLPIDIERLTDQVVRNIDQRIVAHRERVGRVF